MTSVQTYHNVNVLEIFDVVLLKNIHPVSQGTLHTYAQRIEITPKLRSTIYESHKVLVYVGLNTQHLVIRKTNFNRYSQSLSRPSRYIEIL